MKKRIILLVAIILIGYLGITQNRPDETKFAEQVMSAFQQNKFSELKKLIPTYEEFMSEIYSEMANDTVHHLTPGMIKPFDSFYKEGKHYQLNEKLFDNIILRGKAIGVTDWEKIKLIGMSEIQNTGNDKPGKRFTCSIVFSSGGRFFKLFGVIARRYNSGLRLERLTTIVDGDFMIH